MLGSMSKFGKALTSQCDTDEPLTPELLACFDGLPRHALHAHRLTFPHPVGKHAVTIESPLPADIAAHIATLA